MMKPTLEYEEQLWKSGINHVAGVDEVGRGALAGPVVAAAVVFDPSHLPIHGIRDSKTLSKLQKSKLGALVCSNCLYYSVGEASAEEIDTLGIVEATAAAMQRSLQQLKKVQHVLIDGLPFKEKSLLSEYSKKFIVKGDAVSYSIAAASIIAKVHRDKLMEQYNLKHPHYNFNQHVGYGTTNHRLLIKRYGLSDIHRRTFCKRLMPTG